MGKDYYKILGVSKDADEAALKKGISFCCMLVACTPNFSVLTYVIVLYSL